MPPPRALTIAPQEVSLCFVFESNSYQAAVAASGSIGQSTGLLSKCGCFSKQNLYLSPAVHPTG
jgi:hypothetical protein